MTILVLHQVVSPHFTTKLRPWYVSLQNNHVISLSFFLYFLQFFVFTARSIQVFTLSRIDSVFEYPF